MRILIATDFYPPFLGGTELYFQNLAQELAARGHQVTVVTVWHAGLPQHETRAGVHIIRLKPLLTRAPWFFSSPRRFHPPFPDPALVSSLKSIIAQQQIDLVHAVGWTAYSCAAAVQGIPDPPPLVVSINDYGYTCPLRTLMNRGRVCSGSHFSKCLTCARAVYGLPKALAACLGIASSKKLLLKNTTSFISLSRCVERLFRRDAFSGCHLQQPPEIVTIPPVALPSQPPGLSSSDGIAQALQNLPSEPYILFVGALQPHKGIFTLLQAYSLLPSPPPLVLIGTTWPDSPQEFPPSVRVIRNAPHPAVMAAWRRCLFGVAPSLWLEPFGGVVLEAMSCARPVIGTQDSGHADMIIDGKTGYLVPPGDPRLLAEAMKNLIASPELSSTMGQAACQAAERFRAEQIMPQYELLYNRCIARLGLNSMAGRQILNAIHTDQRIILTNAASLTGSTALTSLLGFIYWWAAARTFPPTEVGFASAAISAMTFLGTFGVLGMGTYLMGILPCTSGSPSRILRTSLLFVSISGTLAGALFLVSIPVFFPQMSRLIAAPLSALLWAAGAGVTSVSLTLDDALIGLLQGRVQLMRSAVFAFSKLLLLFTFAAASWNTDGGWIITAWISGALISLLAVKLWFHPGSEVLCSHPPQHPRILPGFRYALQHHALNLALLLPGSLFPLMITTRLSAAHNAYFYAAWMIAAATFVPASALTTVLFPVGVRNTARIKTELRLTIKLSLLLGCMSCLALLFLSDPLLSFFGSAYAREAAACLRILGLAVFPVALRLHFVALSRIHGQVGQAALVVTAGALLELVCGMLGVHYAGLPGLAWAWLLALLLQSGPMLYFSRFKLAR